MTTQKSASTKKRAAARPQFLAKRIEQWPLTRLRPFAGNPRAHGDEQLRLLADSIRAHGFVTPIVVAKSGEIVAGHGRLEAARRIGLPRVPVVVLDHLTDRELRALRVADNRLAELSNWDSVQLVDELHELRELEIDIEQLGFTASDVAELEREIDDLVRDDSASGESAELEDPAPLPEPVPTKRAVSRAGDVWLLGRHRLLVGDSQLDGVIERALGKRRADCVFTDPPYAVYGSSTGVSGAVTDTSIIEPYFRQLLALLQDHTRVFAHVYLCCDWRTAGLIVAAARGSQLEPRNLLVWDKGGGGLGSLWMNQHELVEVFEHLPKTGMLTGSRKKGARTVHRPNVLRYKRVQARKKWHPAEKPLELVREIVQASTVDGELVLDPCAGSGTTAFACEALTGRSAVLVEREPAWCDVALERWRETIGSDAVREGGGTFSEERARRTSGK